jgi:hypothetical protein
MIYIQMVDPPGLEPGISDEAVTVVKSRWCRPKPVLTFDLCQTMSNILRIYVVPTMDILVALFHICTGDKDVTPWKDFHRDPTAASGSPF